MVRIAGDRDRLLRLLTALEDGRPPGAHVVALDDSHDELHVLVASGQLEALADSFGDTGLRVGVGGLGRIEDASRSMRAAGRALGRTTPSTQVVWWRDIASGGVLSLITAADRELLADDLLAALRATSSGETDLLRVISSFLRHHGRMNVVAGELGMHRNTARSRVDEVEKSLGVDLDDPDARLHLWVALQTVLGRQ